MARETYFRGLQPVIIRADNLRPKWWTAYCDQNCDRSRQFFVGSSHSGMLPRNRHSSLPLDGL
jgi:hypothetical protein